jgi:hypothetical protein
MNEQIRRRWIKALRSGKYKQGRRYFEKDNRYCCLGVLSLIQTGNAMPEKELYCSREHWPDDDDVYELVALNDSDATFEQIVVHRERTMKAAFLQ